MNYEQAKQLKDVGFPQTGECHWYCGGHIWHDTGKGVFKECDEKEPYTDNEGYCHHLFIY